MTIFNFQFSIFNSRKGFTLIELMVAISITAVLGTLGIAGFVNYNQTQVLQASANEVVSMLNLAKSRAQSQVKPTALCSADYSLVGYTVIINPPEEALGTYRLELNCSNGVNSSIDEQNKKLPTSLSFDANPSFFFPVQVGGAQAKNSLGESLLEPWEIAISNSSGKTKVIMVNFLGGVSVK